MAEALDFMVIGATLPDGRVMLTASMTLKDVSITHVQHEYLITYQDLSKRSFPPWNGMNVDITMQDCVQVIERDYPTAWASLFRFWQPQQAPRPAIASQKEIDYER